MSKAKFASLCREWNANQKRTRSLTAERGTDACVEIVKKHLRATSASRAFTPARSLVAAPIWVTQFHRSHRLFAVGGAVFCESCCAVAAEANRKCALEKVCRIGAPAGSQAAVKALAKGKWPRPGDWPCGADRRTTLAIRKVDFNHVAEQRSCR